MSQNFLITTALEETWRDDQPVLFLGEWCRLYSRKDRWSKMNANVMPYHWDDRKKLYRDYQYLSSFYEGLLQDLTVQLNQIHGVDHGLRYWRILIGPWLGYFTQILFDRWTSLQHAVSEYDLSDTIILKQNDTDLIPNDMDEFQNLFISDEWNHHLYSIILQDFHGVNLVYQEPTRKPASKVPASFKSRLKRVVRNSLSRIASLFTRDKDAFFLVTYLPRIDEIKLNLRFKQPPQLWNLVPAVRVDPDESWRKWKLTKDSTSDFELCAYSLIPRFIPTLYLEGYNKIVQQKDALPWPKNPKLIWTSNAHTSSDVFKAYAAEKSEAGSHLVIGQHGGHYGIGLWSFNEDHETAISDVYLTWGWSKTNKPHVKPVGQLKALKPLCDDHSKQKRALLVTASLPRQSYWMYSIVVAGQWLKYFEDQCEFVRSLPAYIQDVLTVRLHPLDMGWSQKARWRDSFPNITLDTGQSNMDDLIKESRVYIATYNAATYLEAFTRNIPTIIYWNPNHWEVRDTAIPFFEDLKRVGIFHDNPQSAARHITKVWYDINHWWNSSEVREVLKRFKSQYCNLPTDLLSHVETVLKEEMRDFNRVKEPINADS